MEFTIYRDLRSLTFVRCISPIDDTDIFAEGVSFSTQVAVEKCRSEAIERKFQLSHPYRSKILGIAAHPDPRAVSANAWNESIETLALESLNNTRVFLGISFQILGVRFYLGRVLDRFLALCIFTHVGRAAATQAVSRNPFSALLKAWVEVRNIRIYKPSADRLSSYTKGNRILGERLLLIRSELSLKKNDVDICGLRSHRTKSQNRFITYFTKETQQ